VSRSFNDMVLIEEDPKVVTFVVYGTPVPQGSKRAFNNPKTGKIVMVEQTKSGPWRQEVIEKILEFDLKEPLLGPVTCELSFYFKRPKHHYGTGRNAGVLKAGAPAYVEVRPDADKLARTVLDAFTLSGLLRDDGQVSILTVVKMYGDKPGLRATVRTLP
jgi:Holliday junction resolvase RusA-like endonuclease